MRKRSLTAFWPQYFDKSRSRRLGRRIPKSKAVNKPTPEDVYKAAKMAGYYTELDPYRKYPRTWWDEPGLILVDIMGQKKSFAMNKISEYLHKVIALREQKAKMKKDKHKENVKKIKAQEELKKRLKQKKYGKK